jgi:hypothetical protein
MARLKKIKWIPVSKRLFSLKHYILLFLWTSKSYSKIIIKNNHSSTEPVDLTPMTRQLS